MCFIQWLPRCNPSSGRGQTWKLSEESRRSHIPSWLAQQCKVLQEDSLQVATRRTTQRMSNHCGRQRHQGVSYRHAPTKPFPNRFFLNRQREGVVATDPSPMTVRKKYGCGGPNTHHSSVSPSDGTNLHPCITPPKPQDCRWFQQVRRAQSVSTMVQQSFPKKKSRRGNPSDHVYLQAMPGIENPGKQD